MGLLDKPASVLTHGGHSTVAMASTMTTRTEHHETEHDHLYAGTGLDDLPERHMDFFPVRTAGQRPEPQTTAFPYMIHKLGDGPLDVNTGKPTKVMQSRMVN